MTIEHIRDFLDRQMQHFKNLKASAIDDNAASIGALPDGGICMTQLLINKLSNKKIVSFKQARNVISDVKDTAVMLLPKDTNDRTQRENGEMIAIELLEDFIKKNKEEFE